MNNCLFNPKTTIELIREAARFAPPDSSLDNPVFFAHYLSVISLADVDNIQHCYIDVPPKKVIALGRNDFWQAGETWRQATYGLNGLGWKNDVFNYFESPLGGKFFPAPGSKGELHLQCVGGFCECLTGNHRLVAARSWLANKYQDSARLMSVKVTYYPTHPAVIDLLKSLAKLRSALLTITIYRDDGDYFPDDGQDKYILFASSDSPHQIYALIEKKLVLWKHSKCFLQKIFPNHFPTRLSELDWKSIPVEIIDGILDDLWLRDQISSEKDMLNE